VTVLKPKPRF